MRSVTRWLGLALAVALVLTGWLVAPRPVAANGQVLKVQDIDPVTEAQNYESDDNVIWTTELAGVTLGELLTDGVRANLTITANDDSTYTPNINIRISAPTVPGAVYWVQAWGANVVVDAGKSEDVTIVATTGTAGGNEINVIVQGGTTVNEELGAADPVDIWNAGDTSAVGGLVKKYGEWNVEEVEIRAQGGAAEGQTDRLNWVQIGEKRVYSSIQAAIDAAQPDGTVQVEPGKYEESVVISKPLELQGAGSDKCTIIGQGSGYGGAVEVEAGVSGVAIEGLTIKGEGREAGVYLKGSNSDVTISSNVIYAGSFGGKNAILTGGGQSEVNISGNRLISERGSGQILYVCGEASLGPGNASSVNITSNTFEGVVGGGVVLGTEASGTISDNDFRASASTYARLEVWVSDVSVLGNVFGETPEGTIQVRDNSGQLDLGSVLQNNTFDRAVVVRNDQNEICAGKIFSSIQAAIDAAPEHGIVQVAAGEYKEGITVNRPLNLRGAKAGVDARDPEQRGQGESIINGNSADENYYVVCITADNVTVDGFTITNPLYSSTADASGVVVGSVRRNSNITVTNCIIHDIGRLDRPEVSFGSFGINCGPVEGLTVTKNLIYNIKHQDNDAGDMAIGIFTWGNDEQDTTANVEISDNEIHNVSCPAFAAGIGTGYYGGKIKVRGNNIHDVDGCGISTSSYALEGIQLEGNTVQRTRTGIRIGFGETSIVGNDLIDNELQLDDQSGEVDMSAVLQANTFNLAVVVRDADGEVYVHKIFSRIQTAIDEAPGGGTVAVSPGEYNEKLTIMKSLTLRGDPETRSTIIDAATDNGTAVVTLAADNVVFEGFTVRNRGNGPAVHTEATHSGYQICKNLLEDSVFGLYLHNEGTHQAVVTGNLFRNNNSPGSASGDGIYSDGGLVNALIEDNRFEGHKSAAIVLAGARQQNVTIAQNILDNSIAIFNADQLTIRDNVRTSETASKEAGVGIFIGGGTSNVTIEGNTLHGASYGIRIAKYSGYPNTNSDITVHRNSIKDCQKSGISISEGAYDGALYATFNTIVDNGVGVVNGTESNVFAGFNYWGPDGPDLEKDIVGPVYAIPWLYEEPETVLENNEAAYGYTVLLGKGWNTLSTPVELAEPELSDILPSNAAGYVVRFNEDEEIWERAEKLLPLDGVYVCVESDEMVPAVLKVATEPTGPYRRALKGGRWHLIGPSNTEYGFPAQATKVKAALEGTGWSQAVSPALQGEWGTLTPSTVGDEKMQVFRAYWVFVPADSRLPGGGNTPLLPPRVLLGGSDR